MKFAVEVTLTATKTFSYEIDAANARKAEDEAFDRAVQAFLDDPPEPDGDDADVDTDQLTQNCERCGREFDFGTAEAWDEDSDFCAPCGAEILKEEAEKAGER